jgi:Protein of unknown function (DUF3107)
MSGMEERHRRGAVEVKIGIQNAPRELVVETDATVGDLERGLSTALADRGVFIVRDEKGGKILVPADKIAYIELGSPEPRRVGFGQPLAASTAAHARDD